MSVKALAPCDIHTAQTTGCVEQPVDANLDDDGVTLGTTVNVPGAPLPGGPGRGNGGNNGNGSAADPTDPIAAGVIRSSYGSTAPVRLSDLVNFRPVAGIDSMEPNGWSVARLDTNFYATVGAQVQTGELLGKPASVRFTPVRYRWSYGDGSSATSRTRGGTWAALGIREFDPTPTSHRYAKPGAYTIDLVIYFGAEYHYGDPEWIPIAGTVPVQANRLVTTVGDAKTVLVQRECTTQSAGPGC